MMIVPITRRVISSAAAGLIVLSLGTFGGVAHASYADDSIWVGSYGSINNWRPVARDELILWASPKRAYLVKIWRPHHSLRFVHTIGVTRTAGRVTDFDQVIVDGQRVPIKSIERLDAQVAKGMKYRTHRAPS